ncbi:MAG TPA: DUF6325 family protein [Glaciibacter sp.]|nr:DUF6325 family protein [Glaciibacter sp.]
MADFEYGPVEFYLIGFSGDRPGPAVLDAIVDLVRADTLRLLDLLFVARSQDNEVRVLELEDVAEEYGLSDLQVSEPGLAGEEDVHELADAIPPGTSAAVLVVEHRWARSFAETLYNAGGQVLRTQFIPAPIVNALVDAMSASAETEGE